MADKELEEVYREKSEKYERMVAREDYQNNIYRAIMQIRDLHGLDVIDTGAGETTCAVSTWPWFVIRNRAPSTVASPA